MIMEILNVLKSIYCWIVGIIAVLLGYYFIVKPFLTAYSPFEIVVLSYIFLILFGLSVACIIRNIKNHVRAMEKPSIAAVLGYIVGFASIQTCFASGVCVANLTVPIISTFLPSIARNFFEKFSLYFLVFSILLVSYSLYSMKCFEKSLGSFKINMK